MTYFMAITERERTRGRPKRKRSQSAGTGVKVKGHRRSPRGPNAGKPTVLVDGYARGKAGKHRKKRNKNRRAKR